MTILYLFSISSTKSAKFKQIKVLTLSLIIFLFNNVIAQDNRNLLGSIPQNKGGIALNNVFAPDLNIVTTITDNKCTGSATGKINVNVTGGTLPYFYLWEDGQTTLNRINLINGIYKLIVTDANGIQKSASVTISSPQPIVVNLLVVNNDCFGDAKGAISTYIAGGSPPYSISWNKDGKPFISGVKDLSNIASGKYQGIIQDRNGCFLTFIVSINQPQELVITEITHKNNNINGNGFNGEIVLEVLGGTPNAFPNSAYTFLWNDGNTSQNRTNLPSGTYNLTVTDKNGCKSYFSTVIKTENPLPLDIINFNLKTNTSNSVTLNWEVGNQRDILKFEIQKSEDGITFYKIGEINTSNSLVDNTFYKYIDQYPTSASYYQIKQINYDGDVFLSEIKYSSTNIERTTTPFNIYPNPATNVLNIAYSGKTDKLLEIKIFNLLGKKIKSFKVPTKDVIPLNVSDLGSGVYILQIYNENRKLFNGKFSKI